MKEKDTTKKKNGWIPLETAYFLRGFATLMVIFSHFFEWNGSVADTPALSRFMMALGDPGVGIFLFLSGYAIQKTYGGKKTDRTYLWKRFKSLYLPYLILTLVKEICRGNVTWNLDEIIYILKGGDFWYITVIVLILAVYYFVGKLPKYRIIVMTLFIIDFSLLLALRGYQIFWYDANWAFAAGMILAYLESRSSGEKKEFSLYIRDYVFRFIGRMSLYVYLLHGAIYIALANAPWFTGMFPNRYLQLLVITLLVILFSHIAELFFRYFYKLTGFLWDKAQKRRLPT